jgi:hypothetical protein
MVGYFGECLKKTWAWESGVSHAQQEIWIMNLEAVEIDNTGWSQCL